MYLYPLGTVNSAWGWVYLLSGEKGILNAYGFASKLNPSFKKKQVEKKLNRVVFRLNQLNQMSDL